MPINTVIVAGNTTSDFSIRRTQGGMAIASFGIAVNERKKNQQTGEWENRPNFFDVVAFGDRWERIADRVPKGKKVTVSGRLRWSQWERDGEKRSKVEIVAEEIEFDTGGGNRSSQRGYDDRTQDIRRQQAEYVEATYMDSDIPF